jgi:hypothetical protein
MTKLIRIIGDDEFDTLNDIFTDQKEFGPFVRGSDPDDLKLALTMMSKGTENSSNKWNKEHLFNIIKALLVSLKLAEKVENVEPIQSEDDKTADEELIENDDDENPTENKNESKKNRNVKDVKKENDGKDLNDKVCYFFRTKSCQHGKSGQVPDEKGNKCKYKHPSTVCKKYENYGDTERGCKDSLCKKKHVVVHCKHFMSGKCDHGKKCKFFHQKNLQKKPQEKKNNQHWETKSNEKSSENKIQNIQRAPKNAQKSENIDFLCQNNPHQMACGNCSYRTNSHFCPQQKQVHQYSQNQDQNQNNPNQLQEMFSKIVDLIKQSL